MIWVGVNQVISVLIWNDSDKNHVNLFYNDVWNDFNDDILFEKMEPSVSEKKELEKKLKSIANKFVRIRYNSRIHMIYNELLDINMHFIVHNNVRILVNSYELLQTIK